MSDVTRILSAIDGGDPHAAKELLPLVYQELRKLAAAKLSKEKPGQTLQPTMLVHEAYVRLVDVDQPQQWNGRGHFFGAAAEAMRRILVEKARRKQSLKQGGHMRRLDLDVATAAIENPVDDLIALDEAMTRFEQQWPGKAKLVKLKYFAHLRCDDAWDTMIEQIESKEWVSYIEPPPTESSRGEHVVRYLTRYLTGGPISDYRIIAADNDEVTFMARTGRTTGGESIQVPLTLTTAEFVRRWCLHVLPDQLTKTRQFGGWSNTKAEAYLERCCVSLSAAGGPEERMLEVVSNDEEPIASESESTLCCEHCGSESLRLTHEYEKRPWSEIFGRDSQVSPRWYRESQEKDDIRFWDGAMGEGFSDWYAWYLKSVIESARETTNSDPQTVLRASNSEAGTQQRQLF